MDDRETTATRVIPSSPAAPGAAARQSRAGEATAAASTPVVSATRGRMAFIDGLRGLALVFMVVNHTGRWWIDVSMGWPRYHLIYVTVTLAAPIFLFLVGFSLAISFANAAETSGGAPHRSASGATARFWRDGAPLLKYVKRGLGVTLAGYLLNVVVFPKDPWLSWGILQTIGVSIILLSPAAYVIAHPAARHVALGLAAAVYVAFSLTYGELKESLPAHPRVSQMWFGDFPLWPWISMAMIGLGLGWIWVERSARGARERTRYMAVVGTAGVVCAAWYFAFDWWAATSPRLAFKRDFLVNGHWIPRGATTAWVLGVVFCSLVLMYYLMEVRKYRFSWLVTLGQTALMLYFVHQIIVFTFVNQFLGVVFRRWWLYAVANAALMVMLIYLAQAWLAARRLMRARLSALAQIHQACGDRVDVVPELAAPSHQGDSSERVESNAVSPDNRRGEPSSYQVLLTALLGDKQTAQRLIDLERRLSPYSDEETLIRLALERRQRDNR